MRFCTLCMRVCVWAKSLQLFPVLCDSVACRPLASSVHGDSPGKNTGVGCHALQGSSWPRGPIRASCIVGGFFITEPPGKPMVWSDVRIWRGLIWGGLLTYWMTCRAPGDRPIWKCFHREKNPKEEWDSKMGEEAHDKGLGVSIVCATQTHCQDQSPSSLSYQDAGIIMCGWRLSPSSDPALCLRELPQQRPLPLPRGSPRPWRWGCEGTKTHLWRAIQLQGSLCDQTRPSLRLHLLLPALQPSL